MLPLLATPRPRATIAATCRALLALILLVASMAAQALVPTQTQTTPTLESLTPGADGGSCSGSQYSSNLGAGDGELYSSLFLEKGGWLVGDYEEGMSMAPAAPPFQNIAAAGKGFGTVSCDGALVLQNRLIGFPSLNGYPFELALVYRSSRFGERSATPEMHKDWNFSFVDWVELTENQSFAPGGPTYSLKWISGTGDFRVGASVDQQYSPDPTGSDTWIQVERAFSWFRYWQNGGEGMVLDRHRPDGSVMRYEPVPGSITGEWRPKTFYDPHDNAYQYEYESNASLPSYGMITRVTDPRAAEIRFGWDFSNHKLTIQRYFGATPTHYSALDEELGFATGNGVHFTYLEQPQTSYVTEASTGIFGLTTTTDSRQFTFAYDSNGYLKEITDSRIVVNNQPLEILHVDWAQFYGGNEWQVWKQSDMHGGTHEFSYGIDSSSGNRTTTYTDPLGNAYWFELNSSQSPIDNLPRKYTITPSSNGGRPRAAASDTAEPTSLTWEIGMSSCGCGQITWLKYPSGREYNLAYNSYGKLTSWSTLSPSGTGTASYAWDYEPLEHGCRAKSYDPPLSPTYVASLDFTYEWTTRSDGIWGEKPSQIEVTSSLITTVNSGSTQTPSSVVTLDSSGRPTSLVDVGDTTFAYTYKASGTGAGLLEEIERQAVGSLGTKRILITADDLGRVTQVQSGTTGNYATTTFSNDEFGRPVTVTEDPDGAPNSGQPSMVTQFYRDAFDQVAVVQHNNLDYDGSAPKYDDGSGSARSWIRSEYHYYYDRLADAYVDRRALPEAEDTANPTTGSNPWLLHYALDYDTGGRVTSVTMPNGSVTEYVFDGYGTLYKATGDTGTGGLSLELGRRYFDSDLMPSMFKRQVKVNSVTTTATTTFARNHNGQGFIYKATMPDGVYVENTFDQVARTTAVQVYDSGNVRRKYGTTVYDQLGRPIQAFAYLLNGSGGVNGDPVQTDYLYNIRSQLLERRAPLSRTSFWTYDAYGRLKTAHDNLNSTAASCNEVELEYVTGRDLVAASLSKLFEESDDGSPPNGTRKTYRTEYEHDLLGRVVLTRRVGLDGANPTPTPLVSTYAYNSLGMLAFMQEPQQQGTSNQYSRTVFDSAGRWVQFVKSGGTNNKILLSSEYLDVISGSKNSEVRRYDGKGFLTRSESDALGRLINIYRPGYVSGQTQHRTNVLYDVGSQVDQVTDGNGSVIQYFHDIAGRLNNRDVTTVGTGVSLLATQENFGFDTIGRLASIETRMATSTPRLLMVNVGLERDTFGRLMQESFAYTGVTGNAADVTSDFSYSGSEAYGDPGFRRKVTYPHNLAVETVPDGVGRLDEVKVTPNGGSQFTLAKYRYAGSQVSQRTMTLGPSGSDVSTTTGYDDFRRLAELKHQLGTSTELEKFEYTWDSADDLIRKKQTRDYPVGNSNGALFENDPFHRLTGAKLGVPSGDIGGSYSSASSAKEIEYDLDPGQNRTSVTVTLSGQNPVTTTYTTESASSRYSGVGSVQPIYDGEGNLLYDGNNFYVYDFRNRLSEVYVATDAADPAAGLSQSPPQVEISASTAARIRAEDLRGGRQQLLNRASGDLVGYARSVGFTTAASALRVDRITASGTAPSSSLSSSSSSTFSLVLVALYGYDPWNRRVVRVVGGENLRYAYDGWREVEEMKVVSGSLAQSKLFVWGHGITEVLSYRRTTDGGTNWTDYYPLQDEQGSVVRLLDNQGGCVERLEFVPYGKATFYAGTGSTPSYASGVGNPWTYAGGRSDSETGLLYLRNRYLQVEFGRFCTIDPIGGWTDPSNLGNGYSYAGNAAGSASDPSGLYIDSSIGGHAFGSMPGGNAYGNGMDGGHNPMDDIMTSIGSEGDPMPAGYDPGGGSGIENAPSGVGSSLLCPCTSGQGPARSPAHDSQRPVLHLPSPHAASLARGSVRASCMMCHENMVGLDGSVPTGAEIYGGEATLRLSKAIGGTAAAAAAVAGVAIAGEVIAGAGMASGAAADSILPYVVAVATRAAATTKTVLASTMTMTIAGGRTCANQTVDIAVGVANTVKSDKKGFVYGVIDGAAPGFFEPRSGAHTYGFALGQIIGQTAETVGDVAMAVLTNLLFKK